MTHVGSLCHRKKKGQMRGRIIFCVTIKNVFIHTLQLVKKFPAFMEPESPSPYPQVPATCPHPEHTPSSPHDPLQLPEDPSLYYPPIYVLVSPMTSFPQASPPTPCAHLYLSPYALHALPISFVSFLQPAHY